MLESSNRQYDRLPLSYNVLRELSLREVEDIGEEEGLGRLEELACYLLRADELIHTWNNTLRPHPRNGSLRLTNYQSASISSDDSMDRSIRQS